MESDRARHPSETGRPGDAVEPVALRWDARAREVARAAETRGLHFDTAVSLVLERQLVDIDLAAHDLAAQVVVLDCVAERAQVATTLDAVSSAYFSMLAAQNALARSPAAVCAGEIVCLVPSRLWTRLEAGGNPPFELGASQLDGAVAWERAAALAGLTMTEWAMRTLLLRLSN
ncbi:MAG: hypothetical protein ACR2KV_02560 [Solirubrobacteraceae bacterium]